MKTYNKFLDYYDKIVRSVNNPIEDEVEFLIEDCIKEYKPETKTILETACGTGVVAKELINAGYKVTGLDINEAMLSRAEKNIDKKNLVRADMTNFDLKKTFDAIICNYNSICHLLKWEDWQSFFEMVNKHLEKDSLFVFDINTIYEFESITKDFVQFYNFDQDTVCLEMQKNDGIYEWLIKIFSKRKDGKYDLIEEIVKENSFPINKIKKELSVKGFKILEIIDYHYGEVTAKSERVYFICKKNEVFLKTKIY
ncbi:MAG: class I SAM-dependent methyltransferase [Candidatus Gracilibacteria bacterium]